MGHLVGGLYWPTTLACSAIISLTEGTIRQCFPWCSVDWKMKHGRLGSGVSATAHTSCSNLLAKVDSFALSWLYMPPLELVVGLILSASLGLGSSQALDVSAT